MHPALKASLNAIKTLKKPLIAFVWLGTMIGFTFLAISQYRTYLNQSVYPLDHPDGNPGRHAAGWVIPSGISLLLFVVGLARLIFRKIDPAVTDFFGTYLGLLAWFVVCLGVLWPHQQHLKARQYRIQCANMNFTTRLEINRHGHGLLHLLDENVTVRAVRKFDQLQDGGVQLQLWLESHPALPFQTMVTTLSNDGLSSSVELTRSSGNGSTLIGTAIFRMHDSGLAQVVLNSKIFNLSDWWSNPFKLDDQDGKEITRVVQKDNTSKHLAICGHRENLELTAFLASMLQNFQEYGYGCNSAYIHSGGVSSRNKRHRSCKNCTNDDCTDWTILNIDRCMPKFRAKCKGITY